MEKVNRVVFVAWALLVMARCACATDNSTDKDRMLDPTQKMEQELSEEFVNLLWHKMTLLLPGNITEDIEEATSRSSDDDVPRTRLGDIDVSTPRTEPEETAPQALPLIGNPELRSIPVLEDLKIRLSKVTSLGQLKDVMTQAGMNLTLLQEQLQKRRSPHLLSSLSSLLPNLGSVDKLKEMLFPDKSPHPPIVFPPPRRGHVHDVPLRPHPHAPHGPHGPQHGPNGPQHGPNGPQHGPNGPQHGAHGPHNGHQGPQGNLQRLPLPPAPIPPIPPLQPADQSIQPSQPMSAQGGFVPIDAPSSTPIMDKVGFLVPPRPLGPHLPIPKLRRPALIGVPLQPPPAIPAGPPPMQHPKNASRRQDCDYFTRDICLDVIDYPADMITKATQEGRGHAMLPSLLAEVQKQDADMLVDGVSAAQEAKYTYRHYYGPSAGDMSISKRQGSDQNNHRHRDFANDGGYVCPSEVRYSRPKRARAASSLWKYIVNTKDYTQTLRLEKCLKPGDSCSYVTPHYRSQCSQVYNYHRLLAWDQERGLHMEVFKIPTCCSCHIEGYTKNAHPLVRRTHAPQTPRRPPTANRKNDPPQMTIRDSHPQPSHPQVTRDAHPQPVNPQPNSRRPLPPRRPLPAPNLTAPPMTQVNKRPPQHPPLPPPAPPIRVEEDVRYQIRRNQTLVTADPAKVINEIIAAKKKQQQQRVNYTYHPIIAYFLHNSIEE